jgi:hypothetical protein
MVLLPGSDTIAPDQSSHDAGPISSSVLSGTGSEIGAGIVAALLLARFGHPASTDRIDLGQDRLAREMRTIRARQGPGHPRAENARRVKEAGQSFCQHRGLPLH